MRKAMAYCIFLNEDGCNSTFWSQIGLGMAEFSNGLSSRDFTQPL